MFGDVKGADFSMMSLPSVSATYHRVISDACGMLATFVVFLLSLFVVLSLLFLLLLFGGGGGGGRGYRPDGRLITLDTTFFLFLFFPRMSQPEKKNGDLSFY